MQRLEPAPLQGGAGANDATQIAEPPLVQADVRATLDAAARTEGVPLPSQLRARLESTARADLSSVRIHSGPYSERAADAVEAVAYTTGRHIHFGAGQFEPGSYEGQRLIAHEVAHTLQQGDRSLPSPARLSLGAGGMDASEVEADRFAAAFALGAPLSVSPVSPREGLIARSPKKGVGRKTSPQGESTTEAAPQRHLPSWETSLNVLNAISDIINVSVEVNEGVAHEKYLPSEHPEVPPEYRPLLDEWYFITHGASAYNKAGAPAVTIRGAMLRTHIDSAVADTMPFIDELLLDGEPESTGSWLQDNLFNKIEEFRHRALVEDVTDVIQAGATAMPRTARTDLENATEEEKLKAVLPEAAEDVARANAVVNRFLHENVEERVKRAELEELFDKIREQALEAGETESASVLKPMMHMDLPSSLVFLHGALDSVGAILAVADPEKRKELFTRRMSWVGEAARVTDVVKLLEQFVGGAVAITGAATYALAKVTGNSKLAAEVFAKAIPNIENVVLVLNILGAIHGALVLIDWKHSTGEEKASAALELGVSGIGIAGRVAPAVMGEIAGPLSASLVISFYTIKWLGDASAQAGVGAIRAGLNSVYESMKKTALDVQSTARELATAVQLADVETDPQRKKEELDQAEGLRWNLIEQFIKKYLERATVPGVRRNVFGIPWYEDAANWSVELINRFKPLVGRKADTFEQALDLAADFLKVVARCFADQEYILRRTVEDAFHTHLDK